MVFPWISAGFPQGFAGFVQVFQLRKVFQGLCGFSSVSADLFGRLAGFSFFPDILKPQASKSWRRKRITVIAQCCAKSYIFEGSVFGAINGGNFATVLREASTAIRISVANLDLNSTS